MGRISLFFIIGFGVLFLSSCENEKPQVATIWTDRPEFTAYAEQFNAEAESRRILVKYVENPVEKYQKTGPGKKAPDIVIGENLTSSSLIDSFATLENLFNEGTLDTERFYASPLEQGVFERQHVLLPVSFDLPLVVFHKETGVENVSPFFITLEQLNSLSASFNTTGEHGLEKLGFSPLWKEDFLFAATLLKGARYHETGTGLLAWNGTAVSTTLRLMTEWIQNENGGVEKENQFREKYLYEPPYLLIRKGRIRFYYHNMSSFYSIPPEMRSTLDYRWLAQEEQIPVPPAVLYMGIPHGAAGIETAKNFIAWFFRTSTQEKLLASSEYKRIRSFGIAGGFSGLHKVNEEVLPKIFPFLIGHIPNENYLSFSSVAPLKWIRIREKVIEPWLMQSLKAPEDTGELSQKLEQWIRRQPDS